MAEYKVVINDPKTGKSTQRTVADEKAKAFHNKKIGDTVKGDGFDLPGYEFLLTGGSDYAGFPMRRDVDGNLRKRILAVEGTGLKKLGKGVRQRKTVAGNTVFAKTAQINLKVLKYGKAPLEESAGNAPEAGKEKPAEKKEDSKPEEKKEESKADEKKESAEKKPGIPKEKKKE